MAVLTHARIPAITTRLAQHIDRSTLTAGQRDLLDDTLWDLGIEDGLTANDGGNRDTSMRLWRSRTAADAIGLQLPAGEEIAQCRLCGVIAPNSSIRETDDAGWRCTIPDANGTTCYGMYLGTL